MIKWATLEEDIRSKESIDYRVMLEVSQDFKLPEWYDCGNPLTHWSRGWEYVQTLWQIQSNKYQTVLDAASGVTFFPQYLTDIWKKEVTVLDYDPRVAEYMHGIAEPIENHKGKYDAIVCVSVLEHLQNPEEAVVNLMGCLNPGGRLVCTFDLSLDNKHNMTQENVQGLYNLLSKQERRFTAKLIAESILSSKEYLTTLTAKKGLPGPMNFTKQLRSIILRGGRKGHIPKLAVGMLVYDKPEIE